MNKKILFLLMIVFLSTGCVHQKENKYNLNEHDKGEIMGVNNETSTMDMESGDYHETKITEITLVDLIKDLFAKKYNLNSSNFEIIIEDEINDFARGKVLVGGQAGIFLAAKKSEEWNIIFDGSGSLNCSVLKEYDFPILLAEGCFDDLQKAQFENCSNLDLTSYKVEEKNNKENINQNALSEDIEIKNSRYEIYKEKINNQKNLGVDFFQKYKIIEWPCGKDCFDHVAVDVEKNKIIQYGPISKSNLQYSIDSSLVKIDNNYYNFKNEKLELVCNDKLIVSTEDKKDSSLEDGNVLGAYEEKEIKKINLSVQSINQ